MIRKSEMELILSEDDCAPDAIEYFVKQLTENNMPSITEFRHNGERMAIEYENVEHGYQYLYLGYVLEWVCDDPYLKLYRLKDSLTIVEGDNARAVAP